ncbi:MAG: aldehyde dehydrogenase family protein, partial [Clostridia bacterium]|nr:aldehyde dehydrogenase family protein [Clostridia bacterium]
MKEYQLYINGEFVENGNREMLDVLNPSTEEVLWRVPVGTAEDVDAAVKAAACAQKQWAKTAPNARADIFRELA